MVAKDETKTTLVDNPPKGETSPGKDGSTSDKTPETFTKEQRDKDVSDALSSAGRTAKELDGLKTLLDAREQAIKDSEVATQAVAEERQRKQDAADLEAVKDDAEQLSIVQRNIRERQRLAAKEAEIARRGREEDDREAKNKTRIEKAEAAELETDIFTIATKHEVDPAWLKSLTQEPHNISSLKALDEIAKGVSTKKPLDPDSGKTTGGSQMPESSSGKMKVALDKLFPSN